MSRFHSTHWSVVVGAAAGDAEARDAFCRTYGTIIASYLSTRWRLPTHHERVADGTQDVFVECFKDRGALGRADPSRPFRGYLYGVTANTAAVLERKWRRHARDHEIAQFEPDRIERDEATLSHVFDRAWAQMIGREARKLFVHRSLENPAATRRARCLEARYQQGIPPREIAIELGVVVERVYEMLHQAKSEYRAALLEVVGEQNPVANRAQLENLCAELAAHL